MPWSYPDDVPRPAKNWPANEQQACIEAGNAALSRGESEQDAIFACIAAAENERDKHGGGRMDVFADREALQRAALARAGKYGIAVKKEGHLTPPAGYPTAEGEYGDPVNYKYPADAGHARAALGYFNHAGQRSAGGYTSKEWGIIGARLARLISRHIKGGYLYKGGRLVSRDEASATVWVDRFSAARVLASEMIRVVPLMPQGYYRHGAKQAPITTEDIRHLVDNFTHRATRGYYLTQVPITIEHMEVQGRIGTVSQMEERDDGAYALFALTPKGRQRLEASEFAYVSPEIRWQTLDIETGADIGPSLAGVAVTNYPFFGDRTAMYSEDAEAYMAEVLSAPGVEGDVVDLLAGLKDIINGLNWQWADLRLMSDAAWAPTPGLGGAFGNGRRGLLAGLSAAAQHLPDRESQRRLLEVVFLTREDEGVRYPRSAYALGGHDPSTWALRVCRYDDGALVVDAELLRHAVENAPEDADDEAWHEIFSACAEAGIDPTDLFSGGNKMAGQSDNGHPPAEELAERLAALEGVVSTYRGTLETYEARLADREATIAAQGEEITRLTTARMRDRFTQEVDRYTHIGADRGAFVDHLLWLHNADDSDGRAHYEFFAEVLRTVNRTLAESEAFRARGVPGEAAPTEPMAAIQRAVEARAKARGVAAPVGSEVYNQIMEEVLEENPEMYERHREALVQ